MSRVPLRAVCWLFAVVCGPVLAGEILENPLWHVDVDPATLAINVRPAVESAVEVSTGIAAHDVSELKRGSDRLDWQWDDGAWRLEVRLEQRELKLTINARDAGVLELLHHGR